jgi:hypothetical protein
VDQIQLDGVEAQLMSEYESEITRGKAQLADVLEAARQNEQKAKSLREALQDAEANRKGTLRAIVRTRNLDGQWVLAEGNVLRRVG